MTDFIAFLNSIYKISPDLNDHLTSVLKERVVLKKEYLLKAGHVCKTIWFIKKGLVRCFYHRDAVEVCSWFMKEGDFVISVESFFNQKPSIESIQALEETEVYYLDYEELQNTYDAFPEFNLIGRIFTEKYYSLSEQRLYSIRMQRSNERYKHLTDNFPVFVQRVPLKYIASYIGVTEETLSRIRSKKY